jgi:probable phosphoglycerate mutase
MEEDFATAMTDRRVNTGLSVVVAVRHGVSMANEEGKFQGQIYNTDLSDFGRRQVNLLAKRLTGRSVTKIISSPLKRTYQTAEEISGLAGKPIIVDDRLMEMDHGKWDGQDQTWIKDNYSELFEAWQKDPAKIQYPNGENMTDVAKRVDDFLKAVPLEPGTVIVTHETIIKLLIAMSERELSERIWSQEVSHASVNLFEGNVADGKNILKILKINDTEHLSPLKEKLVYSIHSKDK